MKSLVELLEHLLLDCGRRSGAPVSRDVETLRRRVEHEGDSFITISLPKFCSDFERSLDEGRIAPGLFTSFGKWKAGIPSFLKGFLCNVFGSTGCLLDEPSVDSIRAVRQICLFGKKVLRPCSEERLRNATDAYIKCDELISEVVPGPLSETFGAVADIICNYLGGLHDDFASRLRPTHGPGATVEHISGNRKWEFTSWHSRLDAVGFTHERYAYPLDDFADLTYEGDMLDHGWTAERYQFGECKPLKRLGPADEAPVRVVFVSKTLKTPRVIAVEPVVMQFAQQGLSRLLCQEVESSWLTAGHVNFRDQTINQTEVLRGSEDGLTASLDMSEASDRVSMAHVDRLFASAPEFLEWVRACRSTRAQLPGGEIIHLRKFASMGSALCFPVEALVFFTSIIASRLSRAGIQPTAHSVRKFGRDVYVYGDDLIVPSDEASAICDDLESLGFKVNRRKSFWTGEFRESCGTDAYAGERVTPVYLRRDVPVDRKDTSGILSAVATANQLAMAGYHSCATVIREAVEKLLGKLPQVSVNSPALGWHDYSVHAPRFRWNAYLQRREIYAWVASSPKHPDPLEGWAALAKCFRVIGIPSIDSEHLLVSPTHYGVALKRSWVAFI